MTDLDVIRVFLPYINTQMTTYGYPITIKQAYQPNQVGADTGAALYFYKLFDKRVGYPQRSQAWDGTKMIFTDKQRTETTFQITGLIPFDSVSAYTPADYLYMLSNIMQSDGFKDTLRTNGIAILRISEIRNPYIENDQDRFQATPSFDFTLVYDRTFTSEGVAIDTYEFATYRV